MKNDGGWRKPERKHIEMAINDINEMAQ